MIQSKKQTKTITKSKKRVVTTISILVLLIALLNNSCSTIEPSNPTPTPTVRTLIKTDSIKNLYAPTSIDNTGRPKDSGVYVKFSFKKGDTVGQEANDWDIAFRGSNIIVNGGTKTTDPDEPERTGNGGIYFEDSLFAEVTVVNTNKIKQDNAEALAISDEPGSGWYNYNPATRVATPVAGRVFIVKTHDNQYAKFVILSFYKDSDSSDPRSAYYYTFDYVYQKNENDLTFFE